MLRVLGILFKNGGSDKFLEMSSKREYHLHFGNIFKKRRRGSLVANTLEDATSWIQKGYLPHLKKCQLQSPCTRHYVTDELKR